MRNYELFNTPELKYWAERGIDLSQSERYLFKKFVPLLKEGSKVLDLGTGNGRFLWALSKQGFNGLHGIDLAEKLLFVAQERAKREEHAIGFYKMDAAALGFYDNTFDMILALQQLFSFIETDQDRKNALKETYRVLKPNGFLLCSFLHYPGRTINKILSPLILPIKFIKREFRYLGRQYLPYLRIGHKVNLKYFIARQPYLYWYETNEILKILAEAGFEIIEVKTYKMIIENSDKFQNGGMLHIVCKKPNGISSES
jgi:ubiquinone/menaquinone biosynthesis C-methylase UbiE